MTVDPELCIGTAECVRLLPEAFRIDEARGVAAPTAAASLADPVRLAEALRACPTGAIALADAP